MIEEYQLRIKPEDGHSESSIKQYLAREKGLDLASLNTVWVLKRSIDARHRQVLVNLKVRAYINEEPQEAAYTPITYPDVSQKPCAIVVGAGPGGLFAALRLIEQGVRPIVVERGKDVDARKKDLAAIAHTHAVDPESNYCFGEGGAGANSDGKLYTRSKKRGNVEKILNVFCQHGASTAILADAHPHIGTDKLPKVIANIRKTIIKCGGEVLFQTRMTRLILQGNAVVGIEAIDNRQDSPIERELRGPVILATGHSARDVYRYLASARINIEAKGIAVGVRLEHPSALIDQIQYHNKQGRGQYLPAAEYSMVTQVDGRGVYSFCMCPGGFVIPSASGPEQLVTNGMSPANRGSKWSNAGMVVQIEPDDIAGGVLPNGNNAPTGEALRVMAYQEQLERLCWQQGNQRQTAPAQRMADFVSNKLSYDLPKSSYTPGLISSPLHFWLPDGIGKRLQAAFKVFGRQAHGFLTNEAILIAMETRTSSPIRILRDSQTLQHVTLRGLYPCGEGAGYAGGIVSSAIDGERCAEMLAQELQA